VSLHFRSILHKSDITNGWCLPFLGADKSVVYRSQRYLYENDKKRPIQMNPYVQFPSLLATLGILLFGVVFGIFSMFSFGRKLLLKHPKIFTLGFISHEGPSEESMNHAKFDMIIYGEGWDENEKDIAEKPPTKKMKVKVCP
jgi:hypothetical protein